MPAELQTVLDAALQLPNADREALAEQLWESLEGEESSIGDHPFAAEWDEEIRRRVEDIRSGAVETIPWEEARKLIMDDSEDEAELVRRIEEANRDPSALIPWEQIQEMR